MNHNYGLELQNKWPGQIEVKIFTDPTNNLFHSCSFQMDQIRATKMKLLNFFFTTSNYELDKYI